MLNFNANELLDFNWHPVLNVPFTTQHVRSVGRSLVIRAVQISQRN